MHQFRFLCVDDEEEVQSLLRALNRNLKELHVDLQLPQPFATAVQHIVELDKRAQIDGLLLDLRLDQFVKAGNKRADYRAAALAQEIRTLATEKRISAFPIFLWSIDTKLSKSFRKDNSSQELFDLILLKEDLPEKAASIGKRMLSSAKAYKDIATSLKGSSQFFSLLKLSAKEAAFIDARVGEEFSKGPRSFPVHSYANYIFNQLIEVPGPLIDEGILCARLGIDAAQSDDFPRLLQIISSKSAYKGPFSDEWKRWWWPRVQHWWGQLQKEIKPITSLPASARVQILRDALKMKGLAVAQPIAADYGQYLSTVCRSLNKPLDPMDGFVIACGSRTLPWQDKSYLSREAALNRSKYNVHFELEPMEKERLKSFRKTG